MRGEPISRRRFLALSSLTGISVIPCVKALAEIAGVPDVCTFINAAYRLTNHESLLNIEFYFIGVKHPDVKQPPDLSHLVQCSDQRQSFMIVRLPQQHIAESYVTLPKKDVRDCSANFLVQTRIAGYSYLVFQLFFLYNDGKTIKDSFELSPANLLDWNAPWLRLVVREDQAMSEPLFQTDAPLNNYPIGYRKSPAEISTFDWEMFPRAADATRTLNNPAPITAIEAPYRLILSPELPTHDYIFKWSFSQKPSSLYRKPEGVELWMATLQVVLDPNRPLQKPVPSPPTRKKSKNPPPKPAPPASETATPVDLQPMALAIIGSPDAIDDNSRKPCDPAGPDPDFQQSLPRPIDRYNLVQLYFAQQSILHAKTRKMAFTPLGISTTIGFQNTLYKEIMDQKPTLNLYQWDQAISFGRDQEVRVVTLVKESCFSFMMLHVETTKRRTQCGVSFLDYKEYLIPLEHEKNYLTYKTDDDTRYVKQNYKYNTPFKSIRFATLKPKQIQPVRDMPDSDRVRITAGSKALGDQDIPCRLKNEIVAFWAKQPYPDDKTDFHQYLEWDFIATDWQDKETVITKKLYLLSSVFNCSTDVTLNIQLPDYSNLGGLVAGVADPAIAGIPINAPAQPPAVQANLSLGSIEDRFVSLVSAGAAVSAEWTKVYQQSEQFLLEKSDLFRQHLQNIFDRVDTTIQGIYKAHPEWVDGQGDVEEAVSKFKADFYKSVQDNFGLINSRIQAVKDFAQRIVDGPPPPPAPVPVPVSAALKVLAEKIYHYSIMPGDWLDNQIQALTEASDADFKGVYFQLKAVMDSLDAGIDRFIQTLPPRLGLGILKKPMQEVKQVYCFLEHVESSCKSKVNAYKNTIGVSLYKVEQGIEDLKQQLQTTLGRDWEPVYKTVEDYYHKANKEISNITTEALIFKSNIRQAIDGAGKKAMDFFDKDATRMQLHSLQGYIGKLNETVNKEVLVRMSMATDYLKAQVDNEIFDIKTNGQRAFAKIHTEAKEYIKGAMREIGQEVGGIINPQIATDLVSFIHDTKAVLADATTTLSNDFQDIKNSANQLKTTFQSELTALQADVTARVKSITGPAAAKADEVVKLLNQKKTAFEDQFNTQKAKLVLVGQQVRSAVTNAENQAKDLSNQAVSFFKGLEAKILGSIKLKDILNLDKTQLPKLNKTTKSLYYNFITKDFKTIDIGSITFTTNSATQLVCYFEKPLTDPKAYLSQTRLENFSLAIFSGRIVVDFKKIEIISTPEVKNKTSVEIGNVSFRQELAFLDALSKNIKVPGTGILLNITPQAVIASYTYSFPSIGGGVFTLANLKFSVGVKIPLPIGGGSTKPVSASFGINSFDDPFVVAVSIFGGRGHFVLETTPRYISSIDFGLEFGGYLGLSLGIAQGEAHLMAGMRYVFTRDAEGQSTMSFYGYLTCGGSLTVFGFISITVTFLLCLAYQQSPSGSTLTGTASLTLSVKIGFFEKSFSLTFTKTIAGTDNANASQAWNDLHREAGMITYADYKELPDEDYSPHVPKEHRVFTDMGWIQYCKSFSY